MLDPPSSASTTTRCGGSLTSLRSRTGRARANRDRILRLDRRDPPLPTVTMRLCTWITTIARFAILAKTMAVLTKLP
jgi:hypothetical protein